MIYNIPVLDRLILIQLLPEVQNRGTNIADMRIIQDLKHAVGFTEEEHEKLQFKIERDPKTGIQTTSWQQVVDPKPIEVGKRGAEIIKEGLQALSNHNKLTEDHVWLVENFMSEESDIDKTKEEELKKEQSADDDQNKQESSPEDGKPGNSNSQK